jgi:segregation and condensation protein B
MSAMDQSLIIRIVEAALMAANQPLTLAQLHGLFSLDEPAPDGSVEQALETLAEQCADRGVELVELASGFRFQVKEDVHPWVARLWTERQTKYTRATLETLALIAYRQPITRGEIEQVRGVAVSSNIIKALEEREWIRVVGHRDVPGKPALFGTTKGFLDYFGLKRLDELPPLSDLKDIGELEPQLQFEPEAAASLPVGNLPVDETVGNESEEETAHDADDQPVAVEETSDEVPHDEVPHQFADVGESDVDESDVDESDVEDTADITEDDDAETASSEQTQ